MWKDIYLEYYKFMNELVIEKYKKRKRIGK